MMRVTRWIAFAVFSMTAATAMAADQPVADQPVVEQPVADQKVGDHARPGHWVLGGCVTFPAEEVERQLRYDPSVQMAGRPDAPLAEYLEVLQRQTLRGYQAVGCADAKVAVRADDVESTVVITVEEGTRYVKGKIHVTGVPPDLQQDIVNCFCESNVTSALNKRPDKRKQSDQLVLSDFDDSQQESERAWWVEGEQAHFHDSAMERNRERVRAVLRDRGYDRASLDVSYEFSEGRADLVVRVDDLGPEMILRGVWVAGNKKNSEQEIIECADAHLGTLLTAEEYQRIGRRLWQSARFVSQKLEVIPAANGVYLMIVVTEYPPAPRLSEPLSREEAALLKFREWLLSGDGHNEDLVLELGVAKSDRSSLTMVISFRSGIVVTLSDSRVTRPDEDWNVGGLICDRRVSFCSKAARTRIDFDLEGFQFEPYMSFAFEATTKDEFRLGSVLGTKFCLVKPDSVVSPSVMTLQFEPTGFLSLAHREGLKSEWEGDVLTMRTPRAKTVIDSKTGRLLEYIIFAEGGNSPYASLTSRSGAYDEYRARFEQSAANCQQVFRPQAPVSSIADFILSNRPPDQIVDHFDPSKYLLRQEHRDVLRKLIEQGALRPADDITKALLKSIDTDYYIPREPQFASLKMWQRNAGLADALWPFDTWTWHVWRGTWFLFGGANDDVTTMYREVRLSDIGGPLAWWTISRLFGLCQCPEYAVDAASRGLKNVDVEAFLTDCDAFSDSHTLVGQCVRSIVNVVAELSEPEGLALGQLLSEVGLTASPQVVPEFVARYQQNAAAEDPLRETLRQCWENDLRSWLLEDLRSRKSRSSATAVAANKRSNSAGSKGAIPHLSSFGNDNSSNGRVTIDTGWESSRLSKFEEVIQSKK